MLPPRAKDERSKEQVVVQEALLPGSVAPDTEGDERASPDREL